MFLSDKETLQVVHIDLPIPLRLDVFSTISLLHHAKHQRTHAVHFIQWHNTSNLVVRAAYLSLTHRTGTLQAQRSAQVGRQGIPWTRLLLLVFDGRDPRLHKAIDLTRATVDPLRLLSLEVIIARIRIVVLLLAVPVELDWLFRT